MKKYVFEICIKRAYPAQSRGKTITLLSLYFMNTMLSIFLSAAFYPLWYCIAVFLSVENHENNVLQTLCAVPLFYHKSQLEHLVKVES